MLRDDFTPESDVDVLVEVLPDKSVGYVGMARMERCFTAIIGHKGDLSMLGEAANHVSPAGRAELPAIEWAAMIGMRNQLGHEYFDIDKQHVWDTVRDDLTALIDQFETFLRAEGHLD